MTSPATRLQARLHSLPPHLVSHVTCLGALIFAACASAPEPDLEPVAGAIPVTLNGTVTRVQVPSPSLAGNVVGDSVTRSALVYLPPTYAARANFSGTW